MKKALLTFLFLFFAVSTCAKDTYKTVRIDAEKPSIYLEFVKTGACFNGDYFTIINTGPCEKKSVLDKEYEAVWVRLVNNTHWAIGLKVRKAATLNFTEAYRISDEVTVTAANDETEWDVAYEIDTETGCDFHVEMPVGQGCKRRETPVPESPSVSTYSTIFVKSGEAITFAVKREHLKKYLYIKVFFNYEWELTKSGFTDINAPRHNVDFSWWNYEKGLEKEPLLLEPAPNEQMPAKALKMITECNAGRIDACAQIGMMYFSGAEGVNKDQAKAIPYLEKSCEADNASGCCFLGRAYWQGEGVSKDPVKSAEYYSKSCEGGILGGCNSLGFQYSDGEGVPRDDARAAALWRESCEAKCDKSYLCESIDKCRFESGAGCYLFGKALFQGAGVQKDENRAIIFFKQGCDAGIANACFELGGAYSSGKGVKKNLKQARKYFEIACDKGNSAACALYLAF